MAQVSGTLAISLVVNPINSDLKFQNAFSKVEVDVITGSLPSGATFTGASLRFTNVAIWHTGTYFKVVYNNNRDSVIGQTDGIDYQTAAFLRANLTSFDANSIISAAQSNNLWLRFYGGSNTQNALNLKSEAVTLVIDYTYEESSQYSVSTGSLNKSSVTADGSDSITLSISGSTNVLNHKAIWRFGSYSTTSTVAVGSSSATLVPPITWCNAIPSATSGTATVELETYYGSTKLGSQTYSFTIAVPSSVVPSLGNPSAAVAGTSLNGRFIQNKSRVTITSGSASGAYGSSISSYAISGPNLSYSGSEGSVTSDVIQSSGTLTYTVTVTDTRGRTASRTVSITVWEYTAPTISNYSAMRTNSSGTASESGTSIQASCQCSCSSIDGQNSVTWAWDYKITTDSAWTSGASGLISGNPSRRDGIASLDYSYQVRIIATDALGSYAYVVTAVQVAGTVMFFKKGGTGIGIGTKTVKSDPKTFEVASDWVMYHGDNIIPSYIVSSTEPAGTAGVLWLKPVN